MNGLGIARHPMASGTGAILAGVETTRSEAMKGADVLRLATSCAAIPNPGPRDGSAVEATLTALQQMIREILDPLALQKRSVKEWRSLYKSFFAFFASDGGADETERKAWAIATDVFNTNLVAVCNRKTQVVPMTFQDFVDGVDSFRHDGLREGAQRDIAWQPKKILLLMAAMIGRIVAGWQADADSSP